MKFRLPAKLVFNLKSVWFESHKDSSAVMFFTTQGLLLLNVPVREIFLNFRWQGKSLHLIGRNGEPQGSSAQMLETRNTTRNSPELHLPISTPTDKQTSLKHI